MKLVDTKNLDLELRSILVDAKEGLTDALLNLTWKRVSGSGEEGEVVFGTKPSLKFASGFLLPRFVSTGEDETSDIHLSTHGLDFQVSADASGSLVIQPEFCVYVRALPSWQELQDDANGIFPKHNLRKAVADSIQAATRAHIQTARDEDRDKPASERRDLRVLKQEVYRSLLAAQGVRLAATDTISEHDTEPTDGESQTTSNDIENEAEAALAPSRGAYLFETDAAAQPMDIPSKWKRIEVHVPALALDMALPDRMSDEAQRWTSHLLPLIGQCVATWIQSSDGAEWAYRPAQIVPSNVRSEADWNSFLARLRSAPGIVAEMLPDFSGLRMEAQVTEDLLDSQRRNVRIILENGATDASPTRRDRFEHSIHQVKLSIALPHVAHRALKLDRVEPSYRFRKFLTYAAIGVNCGVTSKRSLDTIHLETTWMPRYVQPRIVPTNIANLSTIFDELGDEKFDPGGLNIFINTYEHWIEEQRNTVQPSEGTHDQDSAEREINRFQRDLESYEREIERVALGIRLLVDSHGHFKSDPSARRAIPFRAWLLLNRTFSESGKAKGIRGWRLFQMAFILGHIPTLVSRMPEYSSPEWFRQEFDEETATLLYFPTGGGKSEAFFGLLVFNLFLDRLRGKSIGVTALLRYPLRLLTLQQAQRLLGILLHADMIRRAQAIGGSPFEIGFWVGSGNTPNRSDDSKLDPVPRAEYGSYSKVDQATPEYDEVNKSFNKVGNCPICTWPTGLRRLRFATADEIVIVCFNPDCAWNRATENAPIPFLITDSDIYRHAPAVILGVIDKLALIGQHPSTINRVMSMFGLAKWTESETSRLFTPSRADLQAGAGSKGCEEVAPAYQNGREIFLDPFPSLIIQDEAHLLEESLGTFAGLFETLLEELFRRSAGLLGERVARFPQDHSRPRLPKVIAATATVSVPQQQFGALYQRRHMHFPYPGTSLYESFYSKPALPENSSRVGLAEEAEFAPELESPWMRLYVSLMTNGKTHTVTTVNVLSAYHLAVTELWDKIDEVDGARKCLSYLLNNLSKGILHSVHAEALRKVADSGVDLLATLVDLMRISLTYVTNKKGGDQVIDAFRDEVTKAHLAHGRKLTQLKTDLISGGVDVAEIQAVMKASEGETKTGEDFPPLESTLRNIVATSAISHGVDVDKFNAMFFAGMPTDIAEFIQASSRVGRTHVGFSLLVPTPHARRDRYIVETHDIFHRFLERMIAPPAITRWAVTAHDRILSSLLQAWLCGWIEQSLFVRSANSDKANSLSFNTIADVNRLWNENHVSRPVNDFMDFVVAAIGVNGRGTARIGGAQRADFYENRARNQAKQLVDEIRSQYTSVRLSDYWRTPGVARPPMTSLRDIDEAAKFVLSREYGPKSVANDDDKRTLQNALRIVRNQSGRVAELDDDEE